MRMEFAVVALGELYDYYRQTQAMWTTAYRDAALVESLGGSWTRTGSRCSSVPSRCSPPAAG